MDAIEKLEGGALLLAVAVVGFIAWRLVKVAPGIVSGNNALTQGATNAQGQHVSAYEGQGIVGTLGAAANAATGGHAASAGESLGSWFYDLTHDEYHPNAPTHTGGASGSW